MSTNRTVEERLSALERRMRELELELVRIKALKRGNWIEAIGSPIRDEEDRRMWDEFTEICREIRQADRPRDDDDQPV